MTIFAELLADHDRQRRLCERLLDGNDSNGDSGKRRAIFLRLKEELQRHAKAEEQVLYAPMLEIEQTRELAQHSIAEHQEVNQLLEQLGCAEMDSPRWHALASTLKQKLLQHLDEEERVVFRLAGKAFSCLQKDHLGEQYRMQIREERAAA